MKTSMFCFIFSECLNFTYLRVLALCFSTRSKLFRGTVWTGRNGNKISICLTCGLQASCWSVCQTLSFSLSLVSVVFRSPFLPFSLWLHVFISVFLVRESPLSFPLLTLFFHTLPLIAAFFYLRESSFPCFTPSLSPLGLPCLCFFLCKYLRFLTIAFYPALLRFCFYLCFNSSTLHCCW